VSTFPGSPKLLKGAIIGLDPDNPLASVIIFQYNPETLTRSISPNAQHSSWNDSAEAQRRYGPPKETITVDIEIDAADQLERGMPPASVVGIHPTLAALEMLLYPKTRQVIANAALSAVGLLEIVPPEGPLTLFVWGPARVLPVIVNSLNITEQAFDPLLNPILAKVSVALQVLTYQDLGLTSAGGGLFLAHQVIKEAMATLNGVGGVADLSAGASLSVGATFSIG
jgi:hypothetical protein